MASTRYRCAYCGMTTTTGWNPPSGRGCHKSPDGYHDWYQV
ncbi:MULTISPECIES: hypothetical protein [Leptotrichia]|uniref:Uncharacterized protein n=1 Tax=Leptotrichia mesophila TaxID=3239303 RepID=A0AB39VB09_9FUSO|nr:MULTISPECIES: hypothetical protein [Leptotrichia]ERK55468.1 hypothetical protein HMPREF1552_00143 [Leptotrichia sp. oral taxon 879 str. F0557]